MDGFYKHVSEAISINKLRSKKYALVTNGESNSLTRLLILSEYLTLPIAKYYDLRALKFNKVGIPIVKNDFVPMKIKPWDKDVPRRGKLSNSHLKEIRKIIDESLSKISNSGDSFSVIYTLTIDLIEKIKGFEIKNNLHLSMLKHIAESMALIVKNGIQYAVQSNGRTNQLSKSMFDLHKIAIRRSWIIDKKANIFHIQGIGIIFNDLPDIPYQ